MVNMYFKDRYITLHRNSSFKRRMFNDCTDAGSRGECKSFSQSFFFIFRRRPDDRIRFLVLSTLTTLRSHREWVTSHFRTEERSG